MASDLTSFKKVENRTFTWTIRDFTCSEQLSVSTNLPSVKYELDLGTDLYFILNLRILGDSCSQRNLQFHLLCTTNKYWKLNGTCRVNEGTNKQLNFSQNVTTMDMPLFTSTNNGGYGPTTYTCLLNTIPVIFKFTFSYAGYESTSTFGFPIETIKNQSEDKLSQLFEAKKFTDIIFQVADKEICAHKIILASESPVFEAMFEHPMKEGLSNKVEIKDIEPNVFEEMLRFIYSEEVVNLKEMAGQLLSASDKYDIQTLKNICEKELAENIAIENVAETFMLADLHSAEKLRKRTVNFIKTNKNAVVETAGWKKLLKNHNQVAELLTEMMK